MDYADQSHARNHAGMSGTAIASLVVGILGLISCTGVLLGPVAIVLGILGLSATRASAEPRKGGRGLAIAGTITGGLAMLAFVVQLSILLPALNSARDAASRVQAQLVHRNITRELGLEAQQNPAASQLNAEELFALLESNNVLEPAWEADYPAPSPGTPIIYLIPEHIGGTANDVVSYDNPANWEGMGGIVGYADGNVTWLEEPAFSNEIDSIQMPDGSPPPHLR